MAYCKIPVNCSANTTYSFKLSLKNNSVNLDFQITLNYSDMYKVWLMDIYESYRLLLTGVPLVTGINLLGQFTYLDIGEAYILKEEATPLMHPDNDTLGSKFILVWGDST